MKENGIKIIVEGLPEDNGLVRASALAKGLNSVNVMLNHLDRSIGRTSKLSFYLRIVALEYKSPVMAELEAVQTGAQSDRRAEAIRDFAGIGKSIEDGSISRKKFDYGLIMQMRDMVGAVGKTFKSMQVFTNGDNWIITEDYRERLESALLPEEISPGYLDGILEYINVHSEKNVFRIYPDIGPTLVGCYFPQRLREIAIKSVGKRVYVSGKMKFKAISQHPHEIEVEGIEASPPRDEIPDLNDLWGIAPNLTGGLGIIDFLEKVRSEQL